MRELAANNYIDLDKKWSFSSFDLFNESMLTVEHIELTFC